jgi:hypothetical protein
VSVKASGNASDGFITFRNYPNETAVLDAARFTPSGRSAVLTIQNQSYVRIMGFEIRNFSTAEHRLVPLGISVVGAGSHVELLRNNVHHSEQTFDGRDAPGRGGNGIGIAVYGTDAKTPITDLIIEGNEVHHLKHSTVVNNTLYENDTSATGSGEFQMQWNMADNVFENNIVYAGALPPNAEPSTGRQKPPASLD